MTAGCLFLICRLEALLLCLVGLCTCGFCFVFCYDSLGFGGLLYVLTPLLLGLNVGLGGFDGGWVCLVYST